MSDVSGQGRPYSRAEGPDDLAEAIFDFNEAIQKDDRVDVVATPFRDGVSIITRRYFAAPFSPLWPLGLGPGAADVFERNAKACLQACLCRLTVCKARASVTVTHVACPELPTHWGVYLASMTAGHSTGLAWRC